MNLGYGAVSARYTYEPVKHSVSHRRKCVGCGKWFRRSKTFSQTVNPFNKRPDGTPKTYHEVLKSVVEQANAWEPPDRCSKCAVS